MGWIETNKPKNTIETLNDSLKHENDYIKQRVLDSAIVNISEYYAAVEVVDKKTGERKVFAAVSKLQFTRDGKMLENSMTEHDRPSITNCPERILKLLTPTENKRANEWREACYEKIKGRHAMPTISVGTRIRFDPPLEGIYSSLEEMIVSKAKGRSIIGVSSRNGAVWKLTRDRVLDLFMSGVASFQSENKQKNTMSRMRP